MTQETDLDRTVTVTTGDVTVEKSFEPESFPVPAIAFTIDSERTEAVDIRLEDHIPEEFPMSAIGFHPEYESENWTAYKDHRVEFERTLDPEETVETVYGVRLDREEDAAAFLTEPLLEERGEEDVGTQVDDVLGEDRNQPVRDVLAGDRESLPGQSAPDVPAQAEGPETDATEADAVEADGDGDEEGTLELDDPTSTPRSVDDDLTPAMVERPSAVDASDTTEAGDEEVTAEASEADTSASAGSDSAAVPETPGTIEPDDDPESAAVAVGEGVAEAEAAEATTEHGPEDAPTGDLTAVAGGGVGAALAREIREDRIDDDDLELLREEIDLGVPRSTTVRLKRLQSNVADLDAYTDALEEFIDEEGTAEELIEGFRGDLADVEESVAALETDLAAAADDRDAIAADVADVETEVADLEESLGETATRLETTSSDLSAAETRLTTLDEEVGEVREEVADLDTTVVKLDGKVDEVDERLDDETAAIREETTESVDAVREDLEGDVDALRADIEDVRAELEEFEQFRERLGQAFGGIGSPAGGEDDGQNGA
jgi:predicted  nucleic acid-binding Zn-ribbon protein